jgi:hypothetical protein
MRKTYVIAALAVMFVFAAPLIMSQDISAASDEGNSVSSFVDNVSNMVTDLADKIVGFFDTIIDFITGLEFSLDAFKDIGGLSGDGLTGFELNTTVIITICAMAAIVLTAVTYYHRE